MFFFILFCALALAPVVLSPTLLFTLLCVVYCRLEGHGVGVGGVWFLVKPYFPENTDKCQIEL